MFLDSYLTHPWKYRSLFYTQDQLVRLSNPPSIFISFAWTIHLVSQTHSQSFPAERLRPWSWTAKGNNNLFVVFTAVGIKKWKNSSGNNEQRASGLTSTVPTEALEWTKGGFDREVRREDAWHILWGSLFPVMSGLHQRSLYTVFTIIGKEMPHLLETMSFSR